jgi:RNA polymerase sigma-70 factor (ECF subfamily)
VLHGVDNDNAVIRDVLDGNPEAFGLLVERYQRPIYNLMLRTTGTAHTAADLAQDTFLRAYEHLERFHPGARFFSWLYAIGMNRARDWLRASGIRRETGLEVLDGQDFQGNPGDQQERLAERLDLERVHRAVARLPLEYRETVLLRYHEDLSLQEVAETLGISLSAAKMRVHRALDTVRRALEVDGND